MTPPNHQTTTQPRVSRCIPCTYTAIYAHQRHQEPHMSTPLPQQTRVVIIGGGIIGCSVAYHLTRLGWADVILLEQGQLSCGTTWHAAGLVGQLRAQESMTKLIRYSTALYAELEADTGLATGWKQCGSLSVARTAERMTQLKRTAAVARAYGVACEVIGAREAGDLWPVM